MFFFLNVRKRVSILVPPKCEALLLHAIVGEVDHVLVDAAHWAKVHCVRLRTRPQVPFIVEEAGRRGRKERQEEDERRTEDEKKKTEELEDKGRGKKKRGTVSPRMIILKGFTVLK